MKECLYCKKGFEPKKPTRKFCSDSCRVMFNRKFGKKDQIKPIQMQVLYNTMLDVLSRVNYSPITPKYYDAPKMSNITHDEPTQWKQPKRLATFQELLNGMAGIEFGDEKEDYAEKIRAATHLTEKQIKLLLTNLWSK